MKISELYIYPIKSLGGFSVRAADLTLRGLAHDRRFMLTTLEGKFLTQRSNAQMALLKTRIEGTQLVVWDSRSPDYSLSIPLVPINFQKEQLVTIWGDTCIGSVLPTYVSDWFSERLGQPCQLVYMAEHAQRPVEEGFKKKGEIVSFADAYPMLLLGQASLDDINNRLEHPISVDRFRPNILFTGGQAFEEDNWRYFKIGTATFRGVKACARCNVPNINQSTAQIEKEPNKTLATFRKFNNKIYVGQNVCWEQALSEGKGRISVGDEINLT